MDISATRMWRSLLVVGLMIVTAAMMTAAHGGEKHEDSAQAGEDRAEEAVVPGDDTEQQLIDSVYGLINELYQPVKPAFVNSCFDCHSGNTDYPWYYKVPGIKNLIDYDVKEAKTHVDMTNDFPFGGHGTQIVTLNAIREEIEEGEMPLWRYRLMHWGKLIEGETQDSVFKWIDSSVALLKTLPSHAQ